MNSFNRNPAVTKIRGTDSLKIFGNTYFGHDVILDIDSTVSNIDSTRYELVDASIDLPQVKDPRDPFLGNGKFAGRKNILITEWGPYDFRSPIIWHTNPTATTDTMRFDLLGPRGNWVIRSSRGVRGLSATMGEFPATISAVATKGERTDILIGLEYRGVPITTPFGETVPAGKSYQFAFRKFFQPISWQVLWFGFDSLSNPLRNSQYMQELTRLEPIRQEKVNKLDYAWWGGIRVGDTAYTRFLTLARGQAHLPVGDYELSVTWDDAVRVYVDDRLVLDEWYPSKYSFDESPNRKVLVHLDGLHRFRVEHVELGGFAALALKLRPLD
jgi:hypothetical protein